MDHTERNRRATLASIVALLALFAAAGATGVFAEEEPGQIEIPTVYRDAYKITIKGKPDANGTFSMVFKAHGEEGVEFTVNVVKGMAAKKIAGDVAKELTLAAGERYKVKHNGKVVIVKKGNKKQKPLAIEMTKQKITGVAITIGKG